MSGKTIFTINSDIYGTLLAKYQPKVIETNEENENAINLAEELAHQNELSPEELTLLQLLLTLFEKYEEDNYPIDNFSPQDMLFHCMEVQSIEETALAQILGSQNIVNDIMTGQTKISFEQAMILGKFFSVAPSLFL